MAQTGETLKSYRYCCEECSGEVVLIPTSSPRFYDLAPVCPWCGFPLTHDDTEAAITQLEQHIGKLKQRLQAELDADLAIKRASVMANSICGALGVK